MHRMLYVYKSMLNKLQNEWRNPVIFLLLVLMTGSLFFSRALLSISMISFVAFSFFHSDWKGHLYQFFASPLLWSMSLLFFFPLLSGIWSEDRKAWLETLQVKLPLLFLPLAFASPFKLSHKQWGGLACFFIAFVTAGTIWSMVQYAADTSAVNESYLRAKSLVTPLENDHVRFSWLVSVAVLLGGQLIYVNKNADKKISWCLSLILLWLIIFLHILAARTGLFSFYIMLGITGAWLIYKKLRWQYGVALLLVLFALPFIAYKALPTFHNRVKYFKYDLGFFRETHYLPGANDGVRVISLKAGFGVIKESPVVGVGFGDVLVETKRWYAAHYPQMEERDKIYPSSEWMIYGAGCGIQGFLVFTMVMLIPFLMGTHTSLAWRMLNLIAAASFLFDIGLEVQFGVFIYSIVVLGWWKWMNDKKV